MIDTDRLRPVVLATMCVLALGVSATTLESTVSTEPRDIVDLDYDRLPIDRGQAQQIREEIQSNEQRQRNRERPAEAANRPSDAEGGRMGASQRPQQAQTGGGGGSGDEPSQDSLLEWLLAHLLPALILLALLALLYRYRRRIAALLQSISLPETTQSDRERPQPVVDVESSNPVYRAWGEMVRALDTDAPRTKTPREVAAAAVEAGMDPDAVRELTDLFERVRYGNGSVTDRRREHVDDLSTRLGLEVTSP